MLSLTRLPKGMMRIQFNPAAIVASRSLTSFTRSTRQCAITVPLIPHSHYFASSPFLANKAPPEPDISGVEHDTFASEQRGEPDAETVQEQDNHQVAKAEGITEEQEKQAETEPEHLSDATTSSDMQTEAPAIDDSVFTSQESAINSGDEPSPSGEDAAVITSAPSSGTPHSSEIVSEHQPPSDAEASDKNAEKSASPSSSIEEEVREKNVTKVGFSRMRKAMWKDMSSMGNVPHFGSVQSNRNLQKSR